MSRRSDPPRAEELLRHRQWLQRLSVALTRDGHDAADVEQQTWLSALRSPPADGTSPRAWLGTVIRNWVRRGYRGDGRRQQRERAAARTDYARPADELAAESEMAAVVTSAVLSLEEPLRTVVLLRFYEGLTVGQVAARMNAPYETTRSRLRTAIARLRRIVTPDADPVLWTIGPYALAALRDFAPLRGALIMTKTTKIAAASLAVAVLGTGGVWAASVALRPPADDGQTAEVTTPAETVAHERELARMQRRINDLERQLAESGRIRATRPAPADELETAGDVISVPFTLEVDATQSPSALRHAAWAALAGATDQPQTVEIALSYGDLTATTAPAVVEEVDVTSMTNEELLKHAREMSTSSKKGARRAALVAWHELIGRNPDYETVDESLFKLGIVNRELGDHVAEQHTFERLAQHAGPDTDRGLEARYQLAWAHHYNGDSEIAVHEMESIVEAAGVHTDRARHALLNGSSMAESMGDPGRARAMLEKLLNTVEGEDASLSKFFERHAKSRLGSLE